MQKLDLIWSDAIDLEVEEEETETDEKKEEEEENGEKRESTKARYGVMSPL